MNRKTFLKRMGGLLLASVLFTGCVAYPVQYQDNFNPFYGQQTYTTDAPTWDTTMPRTINVSPTGDVRAGRGTWDLRPTDAKVDRVTKEVRIDGKTYRLNPDGTATYIRWKN